MKLKKNDLPVLLKKFEGQSPEINTLLTFCTENKCSDLYLKIGDAPYVSRYGLIHRVPCFETTSKLWGDWAQYAISSEQNAKYVRQKMLDFSYTIPYEDTGFRYRVSAGFSMGHNVATFRMISKDQPSFENINFPNTLRLILKQMTNNRNKITMLVGPTGSGKTTTLAACMNDFSKNGGPFEHSVIITLEDPVEYIYPSLKHVKIVQKELGIDFKEYPEGVKQALREHPNFINIGESRDKETVEAAVEAARTGHGVLTSFHAKDVADTISRLYNQVCSNGNKDIMYDLIANMNVILCQKIISSGEQFVLNTQYMVFTPDIVKYLNEMIEQEKNIPSVINKLFTNTKLLEDKVLKDWD